MSLSHLDSKKIKITDNFTLSEFFKTNHSDLLETNMKEGLEDTSFPQIYSLASVAQKIRTYVQTGVAISSGYRGRTLNKRVGGSPNSQHCFFEALDIQVPAFRSSQLEQLFDDLVSTEKIFPEKIKQMLFSQFILETNTQSVSNWQWIHLGLHTKRFANYRTLSSRKPYDPQLFPEVMICINGNSKNKFFMYDFYKENKNDPRLIN